MSMRLTVPLSSSSPLTVWCEFAPSLVKYSSLGLFSILLVQVTEFQFGYNLLPSAVSSKSSLVLGSDGFRLCSCATKLGYLPAVLTCPCKCQGRPSSTGC